MKNFVKNLIKLFIRFFIVLIRIKKIPKFNTEANIIIWTPEFKSIKYFLNDNFIRTFLDYSILKKIIKNKNISIYTKWDIGKFFNKIIFLKGIRNLNYNFFNYSRELVFVVESLEKQKNLVFPNSYEVKFWENKTFMYNKFKELGIPYPETLILPLDQKDKILKQNKISYPFLIKEEHSCSSKGLHLIKSKNDLDKLLNNKLFNLNNENIIIQELLNIKRDLRVILVGDDIVLHYWRINLNSKDWKPTSTSFGSKVDFEYFPEEWKNFIIKNFKKLNIITGAFDIAWPEDDLTKQPLFLEVSPFYQPNPIPPKNLKIPYGFWKKGLFSYNKRFIDITYEIEKKYIDFIYSNYIKNNKEKK